jgi:hypothetical protein
VISWSQLGRPHVLYLSANLVDGGLSIERAWLTAGGAMGADSWFLPGSDLPAGADSEDLSQALLPPAVVEVLALGGQADDLVIVASEEIRALAYPMLPLVGHDDERLNSYAAVTLLPSLSWGLHALRRRTSPSRSSLGGLVAYIHPDVDLPRITALINRPDTAACMSGSLADLGRSLIGPDSVGVRIALIGSHGTLTDDGSVDLRDHAGGFVAPDALSTWPLPPVAVIAGCRTGASNRSAPLHLAEAALVAGADYVIVASGPTTDEVVDQVIAGTLMRLGLTPSTRAHQMAASQALQGALQQFDRAYPGRATDLRGWPLVHLGLPGCAVR